MTNGAEAGSSGASARRASSEMPCRLESDVGDVQGGTTKEGIHMGVMSGTLDLVQRSYTGTHIRDGVLYFDPRLTGQLDGLSFSMQFQGAPILVTFASGRLTVAAHREGVSPPVKVAVRDEVRELRAGDRCTFEPQPDTSPEQQVQG